MPGTGDSLKEFVATGIWLLLFFFAIGLGAAALYRKFPNMVTAGVNAVANRAA